MKKPPVIEPEEIESQRALAETDKQIARALRLRKPKAATCTRRQLRRRRKGPTPPT